MHSLTRIVVNTSVIMFMTLPVSALLFAAEQDMSPDTNTPVQKVAGAEKSADQLAREMVNPLAPLTRFDYQGEYRIYQGSIAGADDITDWTHVFQPVIPFWQKNGKGFVFRFSLPYIGAQPIYKAQRGFPEWRIRQEDPTADAEGAWGSNHGHTGDMDFDLVYGGVAESGFILQYGLAGVLPTSSDTSNARQQFILGPEVNVGQTTNWGTYGAIFSHQIDLLEKQDKNTPDANFTTIQAYFSYSLGHGWQLISNPVISYDWEGDSGNKLSLPLGGGVAKTLKIGKMPLRLTAEVQKYVASTDRFGADWQFQFSITPVWPNKYTRN